MKRYADGRIEKLAESLVCAGIDKILIEQILKSGETILRDTTPQNKAAWMRGAMERMDQLLAPDVRNSVREACACCLGGKREKLVKEIAKKGGSLEERIKAANEATLVFGNGVSLHPDGRIMVRFAREGLEKYGCPCLPKAEQPLSITYCYCCGGHIKHHLQIATGRELKMTAVTTALSTGWKEPCTFLFALSGEAG